jgi:hypothetical protein
MQIRTISSPRTSRKNNFCNSPFHFTADTELRLLLRFLCALLLKPHSPYFYPDFSRGSPRHNLSVPRLSPLSDLCVSSVPSDPWPDYALRPPDSKPETKNSKPAPKAEEIPTAEFRDRSVLRHIPKGFHQSAQRLRGTSYPG